MINLLSIAYVIGFATDLIERGASILEVKELIVDLQIKLYRYSQIKKAVNL